MTYYELVKIKEKKEKFRKRKLEIKEEKARLEIKRVSRLETERGEKF